MINQQILIIGASSTIAQAITKRLSVQPTILITLIGRELPNNITVQDNIHFIRVNDYQEATIEAAASKIKNLNNSTSTRSSIRGYSLNEYPITGVFICNGILHSKKIQPEKRINDFQASAFTQIITANAITPILWIQHLLPHILSKHQCNIVVFSARVGSITDNRLGGWYSYRASKAALNMMLKSAAIEFSRTAKNLKVISFHPGTTDSPLSKPFQKNVPDGKLFTAEYVARKLVDIVRDTKIDGKASFIDYQGHSIPW